MKNTLAIIYNGGAYGTYLEWALNMLVNDRKIQSPFTAVGNSHNTTVGKQLLSMKEWRNYTKSDIEHKTVRLHPKTHKSERLSENLDEILDKCHRTILIYPDTDHQLLCINNFMTKIYSTDDPYQGPLKDVDIDAIYKNFPVPSSKQIPRWIMREHLSYYLVPAWRAQIDWFLPDTWCHERCLIVYVNELLNEFEKVVEKIKTFWGVDFTKSIDEILPLHQQMLALQVHLGQDQLCKKIIDSTVNEVDRMEWRELPLASESWIQWKLRELGYEIKCHDLNVFPLDDLSLKSIIYRI